LAAVVLELELELCEGGEKNRVLPRDPWEKGLGGKIWVPPYSRDPSRGPAGDGLLALTTTLKVGIQVETLLELLFPTEVIFKSSVNLQLV